MKHLVARLRQQVDTSDGDVVADLHAEVTLLREENARLKFEQAKAADPGTIVDLVRSIAERARVDDEFGDEACHLLAEALTIKTALVQMCEEIEAGVGSMRDRLVRLGAAVHLLSSPVDDGTLASAMQRVA